MTKNFIELIGEYDILIPLIQRDYAQGREKEESKANNFLDAIINGLDNGLNLDFIYGKVDENIFTPLDGQQRLTTLLLLHWYASLEKDHLPQLEKFSYKVRSSTKDFIEKLTKKENWEKFKHDNIRDSVENSSWFFLSWKNDPTVVALLNMLNLIEKKFKDIDIDKLNNITFEILYLDDFNLTDELYVKMNARGKPLTKFENFKAEFEKYIEDNETKAKLDNKWVDIFWKIAKGKVENIKDAPKVADEMFYNFFYNTTFNFYLEDVENLRCKDIEFKVIDTFIEECTIFDFFKIVYENAENINRIISVLDNLKTDKVFEVFIEKTEISQWERARFHALSLGYIKNLDDDEEFKRWKRVSFNLINNQLIQSPEDLIKTIKALKQLSDNCDNHVYEHIKGNSDNIEYFTKIQRSEESLKAELIEDEPNDWEVELLEAEDHWYLDGQIGFLIKFANNDIEKFKNYRDQFKALWDFAQENKNNQIMVYRALLTKGNYLPKYSSNYTFCSFDGKSVRVKNDNWKKIFNSDKKDLLKDLLNDTNLNKDDIETSLKVIISNWISSYNCSKNNYEKKCLYTLISNKENIKYCKNLQLRYYKNTNEVYLLRKSQMNGTHAELYTWDLFTRKFNLKTPEDRVTWWKQEAYKVYAPFNLSWYNETSASSDQPSIILDEFKNKYAMEIYYNNGFNFMFYNYARDGKFKKEIVDILIKHNFSLENKTYYRKNIELCDEGFVLSLIEQITMDFKNLSRPHTPPREVV